MIGLRCLAAIIGLAGAVASALPASAQIVTASPDTIATVLRGKGLTVEIGTDKSGDPKLVSANQGIRFQIFFYGCKQHRNCATIQFHTAFDDSSADIGKLNEWNKTRLFGRAYIDGEGDPAIVMDVDLDDGGMSAALFEDNLEFWATTMTTFQKFVYAD